MGRHQQRRYFAVLILILFLGLSGLFLTKTDTGFTLLYKMLSRQINRRSNFSISVKELSAGMKTQIRAGRLEFANADSSLFFSVDTMNINYGGIFELLGKRRLDTLTLSNPQLYIRVGERQSDPREMSELKFPQFLIGQITLQRMKIRVETPDSMFVQEIERGCFSYSGRRDGAQILIRDFRTNLPRDLALIRNMSGELTFKNDIAKLQNLNFTLNDANVRSSGKIRYLEPLRFQFNFNIDRIQPARYLDYAFIDEDDKLSLKLGLMGDFRDFSVVADLGGVLNKKKIRYANVSLEYKNDYIHLLGAGFKNDGNDLSLHGSYNLKDKYISTSFSSHALRPSDWVGTLPDFGFRGRLRANGYLDKQLKINYDLDAQQIYGLPFVHLSGDALVDSMESILLESSNVLTLPGGTLKVRGNIEDLKTLNVDVYGNIDYFGGLELPGIQPFEAEDLILTLKLLGRLQDPDIQFNVNLDTLRYDRVSLYNTNISLFGNRIVKSPSGAFLISFDQAMIDSLPIGAAEAYIRMDKDLISLDYLEMASSNYHISMSGSIRDFRDFRINSLQGTYMDQSIYLLDTLSLSLSDAGFSLSRFDLLYSDALLYGSLDVMNDSLWGSINIAGTDLGTLPFIAYLPDSVAGLLDVNIEIDGNLSAPRIQLQSSLRKAHVLGVNAERTRTRMEYKDQRLYIRNFAVDFEVQRSLQINGSIPMDINFTRMNPIKLLPKDSINADINVKNVRFSKLVPLFAPDLDVSGTANFLAAISGTLQDPRMNGELRVLAPRIEKILADTLFGKICYRNMRLYFDDACLVANNGSYRGNAHLYTDLSIAPKGPRFSPDSSVYAYIQGQDDELLYLTPFVENIESLKGDFFTELEIRGSFRNSRKNGLLRVKNGHLVLDLLANEIENLEGELRIKDNIADVNLKGKLPSLSYTLAGILGLNNPAVLNTHNFRVSGKMDMTQLIRPKFDVRITGNQVSVVTLDENYNLTAEEVNITVRGKDTLQVAGDVTVREGLVELGFNRPVIGIKSPGEQKIYTEYSLNANVDKIYLRNQFIDATLDGEMILLKYASDEKVRIGGQLDVSQGFFNYWASVFELDEGNIVFDQFQDNHELNFTAFKPISGGNRIIASISGSLNNPEIDFIDEDNQLSKAEIVRELTIGQIEDTFSKGNNTAQRTTTALLVLAERPLEQQAQKLGVMSGLDRIDIKGGEATYIDSTTAVIVGGRIGRNFYLTYEGSRSEPMNIEIEYRINNRLSIVGTADDESVSGAFRLRLQY